MPQALYRQWRPPSFSDMVGQEAIVRTLRSQVMSGALSHAYLFCGSRGTGKTSMAKILARAVNCLSPKDGDPCGECALCHTLKTDASLDVVEMDAASNSRVEDVRELLENAKYPPQQCKYKVYIIDEVHMLSTAAFNALLKTLEEPPEYLMFILATTEPQKLPSTVVSRCQRFDFGRISSDHIVGRLTQVAQGSGIALTPSAARLIARAAEGGLRDALNLLDTCAAQGGEIDDARVREVLGAAGKTLLFEFAEACAQSDAGAALALIDQIMRGGMDARVFCGDMAAHFRALCIAAVCGDSAARVLDVTEEDARAYAAQCGRFAKGRIMRCLDLFMRAEPDMRYALSPRTALELCALKCCRAGDGTAPEDLLDRLASLELEVERLRERPAAAPAAQAPRAPRKEPEAQTPPPPAEPVSDGDARAAYQKVLSALLAAPTLYVHFKRGAPASLKDGTLTVRFTPEYAENRDALAKERNVAECEQIAARALGGQVRLIFEQMPPDTAAAKQKTRSDVDAIRDSIEDKSKLRVT